LGRSGKPSTIRSLLIVGKDQRRVRSAIGKAT